MTDFPSQYSPTLRSQQQYCILRRKRNAVYPLWKRHNSFLVALLPVVCVYNGFLGLRSEDVCAAHSDAILGSRALLEHMSLRGQRLGLEDEYALVFGDAGIWLRRACNGGHELFGKHGCYRGRGCCELRAFPEVFWWSRFIGPCVRRYRL